MMIANDDHSYADKGTDYFSLQHYLNKYFVSHNQFHFLPGQYYISDDLIFNNFSLICNNQCVITCTSPASVLIINVTSFIFQSIKLIDCIKSQKEYLNENHFDSIYAIDAVPFGQVTQYHTSVLLCNSSLVTINEINAVASVMTSFTVILIVNMQDRSKIVDVKVRTCMFF